MSLWLSRRASSEFSLVWPLVWLGLAWFGLVSLRLLGGCRAELPQHSAWLGSWFGLVWLGLAWFRFGSSVVVAWSFLRIQPSLAPGLAWFGLVSLWLFGGCHVELPQNPAWLGPWFGLVWRGVAWFRFGLWSFLQVRPGTPVPGPSRPESGQNQPINQSFHQSVGQAANQSSKRSRNVQMPEAVRPRPVGIKRKPFRA